MDIANKPQTIKHIERASHTPGEWGVASTTDTDTPIHDFNNPLLDPDNEVLSTSPNILEYAESKFYRQAISRN
jgi:hypothetical protein